MTETEDAMDNENETITLEPEPSDQPAGKPLWWQNKKIKHPVRTSIYVTLSLLGALLALMMFAGVVIPAASSAVDYFSEADKECFDELEESWIAGNPDFSIIDRCERSSIKNGEWAKWRDREIAWATRKDLSALRKSVQTIQEDGLIDLTSMEDVLAPLMWMIMGALEDIDSMP